jgi:XTP/dITP diphosphohydrolase
VSRPRIVLASRNADKLTELRRILDREAPGVELVGVDAFAQLGEVAETGTTFAENALLKARAVAVGTGLPAVADDSGLAVDVLGGMPGVFSARWCGRHGDDQANTALLLAQLTDVGDDHRQAAFVCAAALVMPDGRERVVQARWAGQVVRSPRGSNGFGYDPIFRPAGETRTSAELSAPEKDAASHRAQAFRLLGPVVAELAGGG